MTSENICGNRKTVRNQSMQECNLWVNPPGASVSTDSVGYPGCALSTGFRRVADKCPNSASVSNRLTRFIPTMQAFSVYCSAETLSPGPFRYAAALALRPASLLCLHCSACLAHFCSLEY